MITIDGDTRIIAHVGHPTTTFRSPQIYNPYFASIALNAAVVPMGVRREDGAKTLAAIFRMSNVIGALVTMPLKIDILALLDEASAAVRIAGACNAVRIGAGGRIEGDNVDGLGFVAGLRRKGVALRGARAMVVGAGGVGSAIAAALAAEGVGQLTLSDVDAGRAQGLARRLSEHYPETKTGVGAPTPAGCDIVVNATPLGMNPGDAMPFDIHQLAAHAVVGEVVLREEMTPLLQGAAARGCRVQTGLDMLYEMIPAYLAFFRLPTTTPERLRALSALGKRAA